MPAIRLGGQNQATNSFLIVFDAKEYKSGLPLAILASKATNRAIAHNHECQYSSRSPPSTLILPIQVV